MFVFFLESPLNSLDLDLEKIYKACNNFWLNPEKVRELYQKDWVVTLYLEMLLFCGKIF